MAKYTTQIMSIVQAGHPLFDFDYPLFDPNYKPVLEQKIIDNFYFREIGMDTVGQFKHFLRVKMNRIMPYYNQLYESSEAFKKLDPYINKDITTTDTRTNTVERDTLTDSVNDTVGDSSLSGTVSATGVSDSTATRTDSGNDTTNSTVNGLTVNEQVFSDTPQSTIGGKDYATNLTKDTNNNDVTNSGSTVSVGESNTTDLSNTTSSEVSTNLMDSTEKQTGKITGKETSTNIDEYISNTVGFDGMKYASGVLMELRETFINIDELIIVELEDLFMNVY